MINTLPGAGTFKLDGVAVTAGQEISKAALDANKLVFTPALNANGSDYAYSSSSLHTNALRDYSSDVCAPDLATETINVNSVNDAPSSTNHTATTNEDTAYTF